MPQIEIDDEEKLRNDYEYAISYAAFKRGVIKGIGLASAFWIFLIALVANIIGVLH